ncbi:MAG TPA: hypothetical protein VF865_12195 [Acidobacteriaceae bacterium]
MNRIFLILVLVVAAVLGTSWYVHRSRTRAMNNGDVFVREQPGDKTKSGTPETTSANQPAEPQEIASNAAESSGANPSPAQKAGITATPASDTIPRNPPNGIGFVGTGKFQVYRQGDITWRFNTETGQTCVLLATETQWRKALVYEHGCGGS